MSECAICRAMAVHRWCASWGNRWFVAGLVAWGIGCGTPTIPGVYVNVANFLPWIQQTINTP